MNRFREIIGKIPTGVISGVTLALILWLTLAPHPTGSVDLPLFPGADKVAHAIMFGFLTFVVLLEWMKRKGWTMLPLASIAAVAFAVGVLGIIIEVIQRAMGLGRTFETLDIIADTAGAFAAAGIWAMVQEFFAQNSD